MIFFMTSLTKLTAFLQIRKLCHHILQCLPEHYIIDYTIFVVLLLFQYSIDFPTTYSASHKLECCIFSRV